MLPGSASIFIQEFVWPEIPWSCPPLHAPHGKLCSLCPKREEEWGWGGAGSENGDGMSCQVRQPAQAKAEEAAWTAEASESSNSLWLTNEFHFTAQLP